MTLVIPQQDQQVHLILFLEVAVVQDVEWVIH